MANLGMANMANILPWDSKCGKTLPWNGQQGQVVVGDKLPRDGVFFSDELFTK